MQIPVLIEAVGTNGFCARSGDPLAFTTEGTTREETLQKLRELLEQRLAGGAEITLLEVGPKNQPWLKWAGWLKDDPLFEEWQEAMAENRRREDEDLGIQR